MNSQKLKFNSRYAFLPLIAIVVDLIFMPSNADPLNPVKFWILGFAAIYCLSSILSWGEQNSALKTKRLFSAQFIIAVFFVFSLFLSFGLTDNKEIGLIGYSGRNNGLLNYVFLAIIFLYASSKVNFDYLSTFYLAVLIICGFFSFYGLLQHNKIDFVHWNTAYNPIGLTVGNPDFAAALLGLFTVLLFALVLTPIQIFFRVGVGLLIVFTIMVIYWSKARQGLVATALGMGILLIAIAWQKSKRVSLGLAVVGSLVGVVAIFGMLQIGPLTKYLYKSSINDRGYDWRAGWHMFTSHPWFGVGLDRYAAYFSKYRDSKYPLIYGYQQTVNNAHNVFIELFATGGIFVGLIYIALILFIGRRAFIAWKMYNGYEQIMVAGVIAGWVVFVAQSIISVDNLSVSIWGWILGGLLVGVSHTKTEGRPEQLKKIRQTKRVMNFRQPTILVVLFATFTIVVVPMYETESRMRYFQSIAVPTSTSQFPIYNQIARKTFDTPLMNPDYKVLIAFNVTNSGDLLKGIAFFKKVLKADPRRHDAAQFLGTIYEHLNDFHNAIKYRLLASELNPAGADNLLLLEKDYLAVNDERAAKTVLASILAIAPGTKIAGEATNVFNG